MAGQSSVGAVLPEYEVTRELGRGAMGVVYLGTHRALGRTVAIKELPASFAADDGVRERFLSEARTVAALDHPHVVVIHDFVDRDGHLAIVMEHLPNGTVWDQFVHHGLAAPRACGLALATLAGLEHAHERGVMHRDIKPENLIFAHDWQLKVTDFGIAQVLSGEETMGTETGAIVGTPAYMSPEQAEGRVCGPPADVYATGAMLYEMLTGALPFPNATDAMSMAMARLSADPVPIEAAGPAVPEAVAEAAMHALSRETSGRFRSAEEFGIALGEAAAFTWGPEWMSESGTAVQGSTAIERAARTTHRPVAPPADEPYVSRAVESDDASPADERIHQPSESAPEPEVVAASTPVAATFAPPPTTAVQPVRTDRPQGADLHQLSPSDMVNIANVRKPRSALVPLVLAAAALAAAAFFALVGIGDDPTAQNAQGVAIGGETVDGDPLVELDLTDAAIPLAGTPTQTLTASFLGLPLGSADVQGGSIDPGYLRWTSAGVVELADEGEGDDQVRFPVRVANSPYPTVPFVVAALVALGGLGSVSSNLRGLRSGRIRFGPFVGLAMSGALAGAAIAILAMLVLSTPASIPSVVAAAITGAVAAGLLGEVWRRRARTRRFKRAVKRRGLG